MGKRGNKRNQTHGLSGTHDYALYRSYRDAYGLCERWETGIEGREGIDVFYDDLHDVNFHTHHLVPKLPEHSLSLDNMVVLPKIKPGGNRRGRRKGQHLYCLDYLHLGTTCLTQAEWAAYSSEINKEKISRAVVNDRLKRPHRYCIECALTNRIGEPCPHPSRLG